MTAAVHSVSKFLSEVAEQRLGYTFGDPERVTPESLSVVVPILRKTTLQRQYVLLPEVQEEITITDTGSINKMRLKNNSKSNVFVRSGTIFRGSTQERALTRSAVLFPGQTVELDVRCVHASKGIRSGTKVTTAGYTPLHMDKEVYGAGFTPRGQQEYWASVNKFSRMAAGGKAEDAEALAAMQAAAAINANSRAYPRRTRGAMGAMNRMVNRAHETLLNASGPIGPIGAAGPRGEPGQSEYVRSFDFTGPDDAVPLSAASTDNLFDTAGAAAAMHQGHKVKHDDLASTIDGLASNLDAILSKVKKHEGQVGIGLITEKGLQCIELFDIDESWGAIHKDAVTRVGSDLAREDKENVFEFKPKAAVNTIAAVLADTYTINKIYDHKPSNGEPTVKIFGITSERFVGEVVEVDGRVMHLSIIRTVA